MSSGLNYAKIFMLAVFSLAAAFSAQAGQPASAPAPRPGQPAAAGQNAEAAPLDLSAMNLEDLRAYQAFYYLSGGRDPLTMRIPTDREKNREVKTTSSKVVPTLDQMERFLTKALMETETALKLQNYDNAIKISTAAMRTVDEDWPPLKSDPPQLKAMDTQIRAYNRLAVNIKKQEEVRKEFEALAVTVNGVLWSPAGAKAVVNERLVEAGEFLLDVRKQGDLRVETVEEHGVVFQFKGMRFRKGVAVFSGANVAKEKAGAAAAQ